MREFAIQLLSQHNLSHRLEVIDWCVIFDEIPEFPNPGDDPWLK